MDKDVKQHIPAEPLLDGIFEDYWFAVMDPARVVGRTPFDAERFMLVPVHKRDDKGVTSVAHILHDGLDRDTGMLYLPVVIEAGIIMHPPAQPGQAPQMGLDIKRYDEVYISMSSIARVMPAPKDLTGTQNFVTLALSSIREGMSKITRVGKPSIVQ